MMYAIGSGGTLICPAPGSAASCPLCGSPTVPKCGAIVVHHWAHRARATQGPPQYRQPIPRWVENFLSGGQSSNSARLSVGDSAGRTVLSLRVTLGSNRRPSRCVSQDASIGTWPSLGPSGRMDGVFRRLLSGSVASLPAPVAQQGAAGRRWGFGSSRSWLAGRGVSRADQTDRCAWGGTPGAAARGRVAHA